MGMADTLDLERLLDIMKRLRAPVGGCPWDIEQDFRSIAPYTIEEAYEVADAIEQESVSGLQEELGDLLFQVVFHAQMASEAGWFDFRDVLNGICEKMVRRHPHVFADETIDTAEAQTHAWERHKASERGPQESLLEGVPLALPALTRAEPLPDPDRGSEGDARLRADQGEGQEEELDELCREIEAGMDRDAIMDEAGDLLFATVNLLRHAGIDPESALRRGNEKFSRRFRKIEAMCAEADRAVAETDLDTLDAYWDKVKELETGR